MPTSDQTMIYDYTAHKYILTNEYVFENGINLDMRLNSTGDSNPSTLKNRFLKFVSNHLYNWIYSFNPLQKWYIEYLLANEESARNMIREALLQEVSFILDNGIFWNTAGVKRDIFEHSRVSEETRTLLSAPLTCGVCVLFSGTHYIPYNIQGNYEGY